MTGCRIQTVDGLGEDSRAGSLAYASWSAEQIRVRQLALTDGVPQGFGEGMLPDYALECARTILPC